MVTPRPPEREPQGGYSVVVSVGQLRLHAGPPQKTGRPSSEVQLESPPRGRRLRGTR